MFNNKRDKLLDLYWRAHPRFQFFKNCPQSSSFLDIGAGEGSLAFWREWHEPQRSDIDLYGIDLAVGVHADLYQKFDAINLDCDPLPYGDSFFDVVYSTHVLEHLKNPQEVLREILRVLKVGGVCYLEVPNRNTLTVPPKAEWESKGYKTSTMNFYDDPTHLTPYDYEEIVEILGANVEILESGTIQMPYLADVLMEYGREHEDQEITTYGLWLKTEWSDYVCFRKDIAK